MIRTGWLAGLPAALAPQAGWPMADAAAQLNEPLIISTWPFGKQANERALKILAEGKTPIDAVEEGIKIVESDPSIGTVGGGGAPNADGVVQLDACIMDGPGQRAGSVAGMEDIAHPISVARRVMEKTPHVLLVGAGARQFAIAEGFKPAQLLTEGQRKHWQNWKEARQRKALGITKSHDTLALLVLAPQGHVAGGCSTSGMAFKLSGRVGDSPILGSGLYVDGEVGAAGATGIGENVMRYCASYQIVEFMRQGMAPEEACKETIRRIARKDPKGYKLEINFVALNRKGQFGAAGTSAGFSYAVATPQFSKVVSVVPISE